MAKLTAQNMDVCYSGINTTPPAKDRIYEPSGLTGLTDRQDKLLYMIYRNEGGYANLKGDSGKETYRGIARHYHPDWEGWAVVDRIKAEEGVEELRNNRNIPELKEQVYEFYFENFYKKMRIDDYKDIMMAALVFHRGNSMGKGKMGMLVTRAVNRAFGKSFPEPSAAYYPTDDVFALVNGDRSDDVTENFVIVSKLRYKEIDDHNLKTKADWPGYYESWCRAIYKDIGYVKANFQ